MPRFRYAGLDAKGHSASGEVTAADPHEALARVRDLGYFPTGVDEITRTPEKESPRRIHPGDVALAVRQLANLVGAGLPMHRSLMVLSEQTANPALKSLVEEVRAEVRAGGSLSGALSRFPREFPSLAVNLVETGESTGSLDNSLSRLAELMEKTIQRRAQIISALIYPALLTGVAIAAVFFLTTFLVPKLVLILRDLETSLPLPTIILIAVADAVKAGWWAGLLVIIFGVVGLWYYGRRQGGLLWDRLFRSLPVSRRLIERIATARFARTLGSMLAGGVPILDSLEVAGAGVGSPLVADAIRRAREQVREGVPLAAALSHVGGFLPVLVHVSAVGAETGRLPDLLLRLADSLDFEVDISLRRLISLLEPAIILIMGLMVGFIVLAILLPIFNLGSALGR